MAMTLPAEFLATQADKLQMFQRGLLARTPKLS